MLPAPSSVPIRPTLAQHRDTRLVSLLAALGLSSACVGDGGREPDPATAPSHELVIMRADQLHGVSGRLTVAGHTIYFEAIRGPRVPDEYHDDPEVPEHEVDVRILAADFEPFSMQIGGHGPISSDWLEDAIHEYGATSDAGRASDFRLMGMLGAALETVSWPDDLDAEFSAIVTHAVTASPRTDDATPTELGAAADVPGVIEAALCTTSTNGYEHRFEIRKKPTLIIAEHSATWSKSVNACGQLVSQVVTCNHGTCASAMATRAAGCPRAYANRPRLLPLLSAVCMTSTSSENYSSPGCCATAYGTTNGKHVCNDDSLVQRNRMKTSTGSAASTSMCSDSKCEIYAPLCN